MEEIIKEPINDNPEIKTYSTEEGTLKIEKTHATPTIKKESYNIAGLQKKIAKINNVISLWEDKKKPYQEIIDKYDLIKPVEKYSDSLDPEVR